MAVTPNTTTTSQITTSVKEIDFVTRFEQNWQSLVDIMGIMRPIEKQNGTKLFAYKTKVTLQDGKVAEGDEIPLSQATVSQVPYKDLELEKYRKRVTAEAVLKYGAEVAVQKTDNQLLNEITGSILTRFYTFLQTGTLTGKPATFQKAIATAIGKVTDKFKKSHLDFSNIVVFVNTEDLYDYYGEAPITIQKSAGIEYIKNFMGADTVIVTSEIPRNKVIAVPADNIVLYHINPATQFGSLDLNYTTSNAPTKLIGVHKEAVYERASGDTFAIAGMELFAEYLDGIAVMTITPSLPAQA